jgi:hypothetical protein
VTGTYYVGLGDTPVQAFENYLRKVSGVAPADQPAGNQTVVLDKNARIVKLEQIFSDANVTVVKPTSLSVPVEFREADGTYILESDFVEVEAKVLDFVRLYSPGDGQGRVFEWQEERRINFGFLSQQGGVLENHYISIEVG